MQKIFQTLISIMLLINPFIITELFSQENKLPDFTPIAPKEQEFVKYMACPVSEYTGIPDITIPLYTIEVDEVKVPINLTYYARGIKVNHEASWVGLGWDLNIGGNVIQKVQDLDDLDNDVKRIIPDYQQNADHSIRVFSKKIKDYVHVVTPCIEDKPDYNAHSTQEDHSYLVFTDFYIPVNNKYTCTQYPELFNRDKYGNFETNEVDSEPDIFIANFLGHKVEFILKYENFSQYYDIKILNTKKYVVNKTTQGWCITSPDGMKFYFNQCDTTIFEHAQTGTSPQSRIQTRNWSLTKIITYGGKEIKFKYNRSDKIHNIDNISESYANAKCTGTTKTFVIDSWSRIKHMNGNDSSSRYGTSQDELTSTYHNVSYMDSIIFPGGNIVFSLTDRDDLINSKKLDSISINNLSRKISAFTLKYLYSGSVANANCYDTHTYPSNNQEDVLNKRLVLKSVTENGKPPYNFFYNTTKLPPKTSYATDYWGYYNGQINNSTFNANPTRFNLSNGITPSSNWCNHSSFEDYCKAGILDKIVFPTGGYEKFEYELNSFETKYLYHQIPDSNGTLDKISYGNGLRIKKNKKYNSDNICVKTTQYTYEGGLYLDRKAMVSNTNFHEMNEHSQGSNGTKYFFRYSFSGYLTCSNNFFTAPLFDISGIGYSKVSITELSNNQENGRVIKYFQNKKNSNSRSEISIPSISPDIVNGSLKKEVILDSAMSKVWVKVNYLHTEKSNLYYGVRFTYDGLFAQGWVDANSRHLSTKLQFLAGMYPILSRETLLDSTYTINYFGNDSVLTVTKFEYDAKRQTSKIESTDSKGNIDSTNYTYPYNDNNLVIKNRISKPIETKVASQNTISTTKTEYFTNNSLRLPHKLLFGQSDSPELKITYDNYDLKGNLTQYHLGNLESASDENILYSTCLWGYNYSYPIAEIENATYDQVINTLDIDYFALQSKTSVELIEIFKSLRENLPDAMITSFTYDPLIGVTSITDPNGKVTNYEYDSNNRLETIKDDNDNVIKHVDYHYYNPYGK
jgi:YD repeat-containing protein